MRDERVGIEPMYLRVAKEAKPVLIGWEILRPIYVVMLCVFTLECVEWDVMVLRDHPATWLSLVFGAMVANAFYFAGPATELYLRFVGLKASTAAIRIVLLLLGVFVAFLLTRPYMEMLVLPLLPDGVLFELREGAS